jgi:hypothetical protein
MSPSLFVDSRVCCSCGSQARVWQKDGPVILAVSCTIYRRGRGKGTLKGCKRVRICSECFEKVLAGDGIFRGSESRKFLAALTESLGSRYSGMLQADSIVPSPNSNSPASSIALFESES